jgi:hypothetical protein
MVSQIVIQSTTNMKKIQTMVRKLDIQLNNERKLNKVKASKVKELEN